jgi:hypothetical protein
MNLSRLSITEAEFIYRIVGQKCPNVKSDDGGWTPRHAKKKSAAE